MRRPFSLARLQRIDTMKSAPDEDGFFVFAPVAQTACRTKIHGRGELAFYQQGARARPSSESTPATG